MGGTAEGQKAGVKGTTGQGSRAERGRLGLKRKGDGNRN